MLDPSLVEVTASALGTPTGLIEKDWHVVRALGVIARFDHGDIVPAFSGGTSLCKGWSLIKRFSEDIDFKVSMPKGASENADRKRRSQYRDDLLAALQAEGFVLAEDVVKGDGSRFFSANLAYETVFPQMAGLRPHIRLEMSFGTPALPATPRQIRSFVAMAKREPPEVAFACIDPVETAADKLSALAWRVCTRNRDAERDDPSVIRHLHDLAALEATAVQAEAFPGLVHAAATGDAGRGGGQAPTDVQERFARMLELLEGDAMWATEYESYVHDASFAAPEERYGFATALEALKRLVTKSRIGPK